MELIVNNLESLEQKILEVRQAQIEFSKFSQEDTHG